MKDRLKRENEFASTVQVKTIGNGWISVGSVIKTRKGWESQIFMIGGKNKFLGNHRRRRDAVEAISTMAKTSCDSLHFEEIRNGHFIA